MTGRVDLQVRIDPIDPLIFGDNRSARAGEDHALADQDPSPATVFGAVGGRIAAALGARGEEGWEPAREVLGEFEPALDRGSPERSELRGYCYRSAEGQLWFPRPLTLRVERVGHRLFALPGVRPAEEEGPGLSSVPFERPLESGVLEEGGSDAEPPEEVEEPLLVSESLLGLILSGGFPPHREPLAGRVIAADALYRQELRAGLTMDNSTGAAVAGRLFSRPYRRFQTAVDAGGGGFGTAGFTTWYRVLEPGSRAARDFSGVGFFGGDRRRARFAFEVLAEEPLAKLQSRVAAAVEGSRGFLLYLLTPAVVPAGGLALEGRHPLAAALGRTTPASGWQAAARRQQPRPLRMLAPTGSVLYFVWGEEGEDPEARSRRLRELWLAPLDEAYRNAGFGRVLPGVWR